MVCRNAPAGVFGLAYGLLRGCKSILMCCGRAYFPFCQLDWFEGWDHIIGSQIVDSPAFYLVAIDQDVASL